MQLIIDLCPGYSSREILEFHGRDKLAVAEQVTGNVLRKGIIWEGQPACLTIRFSGQQVEAILDTDVQTPDKDKFIRMMRHILGLTQAVEVFEREYHSHALLGPLLKNQAGLRVAVCATPFEALTWAITGQQISLSAAISLRRRMIQTAGIAHPNGLLCYPSARVLSEMEPQLLKEAGFSQTKVSTLINISQRVVKNTLPLDEWLLLEPPHEEIRQQLMAIKGIGPWTVSYTLLRGYGWLDGSLHGDAAVRRGIKRLTNSSTAITEIEAMHWLQPFSPWRALVAAHLWASNSAPIPQHNVAIED